MLKATTNMNARLTSEAFTGYISARHPHFLGPVERLE